MSILVVGSVALDTVETPMGRVEDEIGGSAIYFSSITSVTSSRILSRASFRAPLPFSVIV